MGPGDAFSRGIVAGAVSVPKPRAVTEAEVPSAVTVSSPDLLRAARVVRALQGALEAALWAIVAGSVLAFGVRPRLGLLDPLGGLLPRRRDRASAGGRGGGPAPAAGRPPRRLPRVLALAGRRAAPGRPRARVVDRPARAGAAPGAAPPARPRLPRARAAAARAARGRDGDARARGDPARDHVRARLPAAAPVGGGGLRSRPRAAALPDDAGLARGGARPRRARAARERDEARLRLLRVARGRAALRPLREPQPLRGLHAARPARSRSGCSPTPGGPTRGAWARARTPAARSSGCRRARGRGSSTRRCRRSSGSGRSSPRPRAGGSSPSAPPSRSRRWGSARARGRRPGRRRSSSRRWR